jgi:hypothetical protein
MYMMRTHTAWSIASTQEGDSKGNVHSLLKKATTCKTPLYSSYCFHARGWRSNVYLSSKSVNIKLGAHTSYYVYVMMRKNLRVTFTLFLGEKSSIERISCQGVKKEFSEQSTLVTDRRLKTDVCSRPPATLFRERLTNERVAWYDRRNKVR